MQIVAELHYNLLYMMCCVYMYCSASKPCVTSYAFVTIVHGQIKGTAQGYILNRRQGVKVHKLLESRRGLFMAINLCLLSLFMCYILHCMISTDQSLLTNTHGSFHCKQGSLQETPFYNFLRYMKQNLQLPVSNWKIIPTCYHRNKGKVENIYTPDSAIHSGLQLKPDC